MENRDAAYLLYEEGWDQKRIAQALRVTEKTVGNWKKSDRWEKKRIEKTLAKETSEDKLWKLINYQLTALEKKTEEWIMEKNYRLLDKGDIDALTKMFSSVKGKQHTWAQIVQLITEFVRFCEERRFTLAKELTELTDEFLISKKGNI